MLLKLDIKTGIPHTNVAILAAGPILMRSRYGLPVVVVKANYTCYYLAIAARNIAFDNIFTNDLSCNRPPRCYSGAVIFFALFRYDWGGVNG